ncbi:transcriptional regulator, TetR family [Rhodobacteraceae bacterium KLH11]|nr:transcriptional regulator, TetR family [Rhodobacteraceae bacterium KLH11]
MARHREFDIDQALDRAMDVFWRYGYAGAPIQEICDAMQLKPGSVYAAFGNKHGLFLAVVRRYIEQMNHPGMEMIRTNPNGVDGIRDYFDFIADGIINGNRVWGCLGTNAFIELKESDAELSAIMTDHLSSLEAAFYEALSRDGIENARDQAKYLLCFAQGLNVVAKTALDQSALAATIEAALAPLQKRSASAA